MGMMTDIREYTEGFPVEIVERDGRPVIQTLNQGGNDCTQVDLLDVLRWINEHGVVAE